MLKNQGKMKWENAVDLLTESDIDLNIDEGYFICPYCDELVLTEDYPEIPAERDPLGNLHPFCPICGCFLED